MIDILSNIKDTRNKIVLAYNFQIVNNIENEAHDIKADYIITNNRIYKSLNLKINYLKKTYVYNNDYK